MGQGAKWKPKEAEVVAALKKSGGNISAVARGFNVDRRTVHRWLAERPHLAEVIHDARETVHEAIESAVIREALAGNIRAAALWLHSQARHRGWGEPLQGSQEPITLRVVYGERPALPSPDTVDGDFTPIE